MGFHFDLERDEYCCGFCQNWVMTSGSYGECVHWHEIMVKAGLKSGDMKPTITHEDGKCDNFTPDYGQIRDYRNADYTQPGAV